MGSVLLVEDNPLTRQVARRSLFEAGHAVLEAGSGSEAIAHLSSLPVDLVLQDVGLPDIDGLELVGKLRELRPGALPILAFTSHPETEALLDAGFTGVLRKPFDVTSLAATVNVYLPQVAVLKTSRSVLVVDDDVAQLRLMFECFKRAGFEVRTSNAGNALERLRQGGADVVVADLLSAVDGFTLCEQLRRRGHRGPVLLTTAHEVTVEVAQLARSAGAQGIVQRSADLSELKTAVDAVLEGRDVAPSPSSSLIEKMRTAVAQRSDSARRFKMWKAMSVVLSRLGLVARGRPLAELLDEVLVALIDASGFSCGAAYLRGNRGSLELRAQLGLGTSTTSVPPFWRELDLLDALTVSGRPYALKGQDAQRRYWLEQMKVSSALLIPLTAGGSTAGLIVLATHQHDMSDDWLEVAHAVAGPVGQAIELVSTLSRISASEHRFRGIAESIGEALVVTTPGRSIVYANPAAERLFGAPLGGRALAKLLPFEGDAHAGFAARCDGGQVPVEVSRRQFEDPPGTTNLVFAIRDLSVQRELAELERIATRDPLTGLFNRRRFDEEVARCLAESRRHGTPGALVIFDLDRFKPINDTYGHAAGDAVLRAVGEVIARITRRSDAAGRFGGDEFVALLNHVNGPGAMAYAAKIVAGITELKVPFEGHTLTVGASAGIALFPQHGTEADRLFAVADAALYASKRAGRGQVTTATGSSPKTAQNPAS